MTEYGKFTGPISVFSRDTVGIHADQKNFVIEQFSYTLFSRTPLSKCFSGYNLIKNSNSLIFKGLPTNNNYLRFSFEIKAPLGNIPCTDMFNKFALTSD